MKLERREVKNGVRKDIFFIPGSKNRLVYEKFRYYIADENGKEISKKYNEISEFQKTLAIFTQGDKKGVINLNGREVLKQTYEKIGLDGRFIRICSGGLWGLADSRGHIIFEPQFNFIEKFINGFAKVQLTSGRWGVINEQGEFVLPAKYWYIGALDDVNNIVVKNYLAYGVININGESKVPFKYKKISVTPGRTVLYNESKFDSDAITV